MVIYNLDIVGIAISPNEADAPLFINANAMLTNAISGQLLEAICRWNAQIMERLRAMWHA